MGIPWVEQQVCLPGFSSFGLHFSYCWGHFYCFFVSTHNRTETQMAKFMAWPFQFHAAWPHLQHPFLAPSLAPTCPLPSYCWLLEVLNFLRNNLSSTFSISTSHLNTSLQGPIDLGQKLFKLWVSLTFAACPGGGEGRISSPTHTYISVYTNSCTWEWQEVLEAQQLQVMRRRSTKLPQNIYKICWCIGGGAGKGKGQERWRC